MIAPRYLLPKSIIGIIYDYLQEGCITSLPADAQIAVYNGGIVYCDENRLYKILFKGHVKRCVTIFHGEWRTNSVAVSNNGKTFSVALSKDQQRCTHIIRNGRSIGRFCDTPEFPTLISEDGRKILTHISLHDNLKIIDGLVPPVLVLFILISALLWAIFRDFPSNNEDKDVIQVSMQWGSITMLAPSASAMILYALYFCCRGGGFQVSDLDDRCPAQDVPGDRLLGLSANFNRIVTDRRERGELDESEGPHPASPQPLRSGDGQIALTDFLVHPSHSNDGEEMISSMDGRTMITVRNVDNRREIVLPIDFDTFELLFTLD